MQIETETLVSVNTYADMNNVTVKTVYNWIEKKEIKVVVIDTKIFIDVKESEEIRRKSENYLAKLLWVEFYKKQYGVSPAFNVKEASNMKMLMKYLNSISDNKGLPTFEYILQNWRMIDAFIRKAGTISVLNSNINNVIITLKNGKQDKHNDTIDAFNNL